MMRLAAFISFSAVLLAIATLQGAFPHSVANTADSATFACAPGSAGDGLAGGDCSGSSSGGAQPATVSHTVLEGACAGGDLHVMRYTDGASPEMLAATWCGGE